MRAAFDRWVDDILAKDADSSLTVEDSTQNDCIGDECGVCPSNVDDGRDDCLLHYEYEFTGIGVPRERQRGDIECLKRTVVFCHGDLAVRRGC